MPPVKDTQNRLKYWRSLDEFSATNEFTGFIESNFPTEAEMLQPATRRRFLQIMGASMALAGLTACRWPKEKIYPHANRPDGFVPGVPVKFATSMEMNGVGTGLLATSYDGRPIKVDGNPSDPNSKGSSTSFTQAGVLDLYDPDRSSSVASYENKHEILKSLDDFKAYSSNLFENLERLRGKGLYFLSESSSSLSVAAAKKRLLAKLPEAKWYEYEPICDQNVVDGSILAFGSSVRTQLHLNKAHVIVSLDDDILGMHPNSLRYSRDYADANQPEEGKYNRLYAIESHFSTTGAAADHRLALRAQDVERFALALAKGLLNHEDINAGSAFNGIQSALDDVPEFHGNTAFLNAVVNDLAVHQGTSVVTAGASQTPITQAVVHAINTFLGNRGNTVSYSEETKNHAGHLASIKALAGELKTGKVNTLILIGGNPVYDAPTDLDFSSLLSTATNKVHLSHAKNETSKACDWHVNRSHFLESWGDSRGYDGTHYLAQPLIEPLYGGLSTQEFLAVLAKDKISRGYDIVRDMVKEHYAPVDLDGFLRRCFHDGVIQKSQFETTQPSLNASNIAHAIQADQANTAATAGKHAGAEHIEITFIPDSSVYDGRYNNNGWLQEVPDFITKLTWDNAAFMSLHTGNELNVQHGEIVKITQNGQELEIAAYLLPGMPDYSIALPLGYGRSEAGKVGTGTGFNTYLLRTSGSPFTAADANIEPTGRKYTLASTQDHFTIENLGFNERQTRLHTLIREADVKHYEEHPNFAQHVGHAPKDVHLWKQFEYNDYKWGMSIDLNACTGCNACVVSCQAENNIPVVGKDEVERGREMHWLRIDRYFQGEPEAPKVVHQPLACVHCENAPCEQVCPVAATLHDDEGLNVMVYNRCIGTRYCSNNCPFKVRRFNFFWNHENKTEVEKMVYNPDVTVRTRGVMEKCTYCVQRIQNAKITANNENRRVRDGDITTACQDACPTNAIQFGDLNDPNSAVKKFHENSRSYTLLDELMVKPRTVYLAKVNNPNSSLANEHDSSEHSH